MIRVNKEEFLNALEGCQPGLAQREIVEQSTCFIFQDGYIHTFNDETACRCVSPLGKKFVGAVQAEPLLGLLRKLSEEEIDIKEGEGELVIKGEGRGSGIRMEKDVLLPLQAIDSPNEWYKLHEDFGDAVGLVHQCAGKDENKFSLTCIHVAPKWIEATDFFQLCRWKIRTGFKEPVLLRHTAVRHVAALGAREFSETESWVHFRSPHGLVLSCRRYSDVADFPDLGKYLQVTGEVLKLPKSLPEAVDKAQIFTAEEGEGNNYVSIDLRPGRLKLRGQGPQGWYQEIRKTKYEGASLSFLIPPALLVDLVKKHTLCAVSEDYLIVESGSYKYITCLARAGSGNGNGDGKHKGKAQDEEE